MSGAHAPRSRVPGAACMLAIVSFDSTTLEPEPRSDELSIDRTLAWLVPLDGPDRSPVELRAGDELSIGRSRSSSISR